MHTRTGSSKDSLRFKVKVAEDNNLYLYRQYSEFSFVYLSVFFKSVWTLLTPCEDHLLGRYRLNVDSGKHRAIKAFIVVEDHPL